MEDNIKGEVLGNILASAFLPGGGNAEGVLGNDLAGTFTPGGGRVEDNVKGRALGNGLCYFLSHPFPICQFQTHDCLSPCPCPTSTKPGGDPIPLSLPKQTLSNFICLVNSPAPEVKADSEEGNPQGEEEPDLSQEDQGSGSDSISVSQEGGQLVVEVHQPIEHHNSWMEGRAQEEGPNARGEKAQTHQCH